MLKRICILLLAISLLLSACSGTNSNKKQPILSQGETRYAFHNKIYVIDSKYDGDVGNIIGFVTTWTNQKWDVYSIPNEESEEKLILKKSDGYFLFLQEQ